MISQLLGAVIDLSCKFLICLFFHPVKARAQQYLGVIYLDLEEFEEAQKYLQDSYETCKGIYGKMEKIAKQTHVGMALRLAGNSLV